MQKTITTPSGYTVKLLTDLTYGQYMEIQKALMANITIDPTTQKPQSISAASLLGANEKAAQLLILEIVSPKGEAFPGTVNDLPRRDGAFVMAEIDKITADNAGDEKKVS